MFAELIQGKFVGRGGVVGYYGGVFMRPVSAFVLFVKVSTDDARDDQPGKDNEFVTRNSKFYFQCPEARFSGRCYGCFWK